MKRFRDLDWLWLFLLSWIAPLVYERTTGLHYWSSLVFWLVPIFALLPRVLFHTDRGGRRRRAFWTAAIGITVLGLTLDFAFGHLILRFDHPGVRYLALVPAPFGPPIPIEEVLFYALGPIAVLLVYVWCDEFWLDRYNVADRRAELSSTASLKFAPLAIAWGAALILTGIILRSRFRPGSSLIPAYFTFIVLAAIAPAIARFRAVVNLVNWRAFAITTLYLLFTSLFWEVVLALPRHWWGYHDNAMLGIWFEPFVPADGSHVKSPSDPWPIPIEALVVWIATPFSLVLAYEAIKSRLYRLNPAKRVYEP